jgi:hypothetical protein
VDRRVRSRSGTTDEQTVGQDGLEPTPQGSPTSGRVVAAILVVAVVAAAVLGWLWLDIGGSRPLPGTPLAIQTDPPPAPGFVCGRDVIPPARLLVDGDALILIASNGGDEIPVVWPAGYAAREDQGRGGIYDPSGYLVAREGQNIQERFFGSPGADKAFHVCRIARD